MGHQEFSYENMHDPSKVCIAEGCCGGVSFATCSADGSIRLWDLELQSVSSDSSLPLSTEDNIMRSPSAGSTQLARAGVFERDSVASGFAYTGYRSMAVSSDGRYLGAGDFKGNLHIFNLHTAGYMCLQGTHDGEILSLSFSLQINDSPADKVPHSHYFLVSGGKDGMIHLYDVERNFDLIASFGEHSAPVTSVKCACRGTKILSCNADRSMAFYDVAMIDSTYKTSCYHRVLPGLIHDMAVDASTEVAVTIGKDKKINTFSIPSGKLIKSFKHNGDFGDPIKVSLDPSFTYMVCSYSKKILCLYDLMAGNMVAQAAGHGDVTTGVIFLPDCKHLVSVSSDGGIFVWQVPDPLSSRMLSKIKENACPLSSKKFATPAISDQIKLNKVNHHQSEDKSMTAFQVNQRVLCREGSSPETAFKFSISRLPKWAQAKITHLPSLMTDLDSSSAKKGDSSVYPTAESCELQCHTEDDTESRKELVSNCLSYSDCSKGCSSLRGTPSFLPNKRWLTVHTVCLDLLNSPEVWNVKQLEGPSSSFRNTLPGQAAETSHDIKRIKWSSTDFEADLSVKENSVVDTSEHNLVHSSVKLKTEKTEPANETVHACEEAIDGLDAAAERTLQLFYKLTNQHSGRESASEQENQLFAKAAEMLVPIAKKIHAIAKMAQSGGSNGKAEMDITDES